MEERLATTNMTLAREEFEKRFLAFVHQSGSVITAPSIAYNLSLPIEEAQERLLELELNGTLQQATDARGDSYYVMPHRPAPGTMPVSQTVPHAPYNPAALAAAPIASPGAKAMNINGLVLNVVVPGAGSLVCGRMIGIAMLALALLGVVLMFMPLGFGRLIGVVPIVFAYLWSIVAGVQLLNEKEPGPGIPV